MTPTLSEAQGSPLGARNTGSVAPCSQEPGATTRPSSARLNSFCQPVVGTPCAVLSNHVSSVPQGTQHWLKHQGGFWGFPVLSSVGLWPR